jgi:hypothetical protein
MKFFDVEGISKRTLSFVFILKIICGLILWSVYTFYYKDRAISDIYKYFDASKIMFDALKTNPIHFFKMLTGIGNNAPEFLPYYDKMNFWSRQIESSIYNDSHTIIRFNTLVRFFSFGYYNVHTVFICFLSLIGLTAIYKTFYPLLQDKKQELFISVFLLPSVLFWGSGVLKEGLILFALGLFIYYFNQLFKFKAIIICLGVGLLLALSKFYVWLSIMPGLIFILWINKSKGTKKILKFTTIICIMAIIGLNIDKFTSIQNPLITLSQKQIEFNKLANGLVTDAYNKPIAIPQSAIKINILKPTLKSLVSNSPQALTNVLFRPFPWELKSPMMIFAGVENMAIILFIILCIIFIKPLSKIRWEYVLFCSSFVIIQFIIIGCTTPIIGAITRYKVPALPFLLITFLLLLDKDKLVKKFPFYLKIFK